MSAVVTCLSLLALAQNQRPLPPGAPDDLVASSVRVSVVVSDLLDPDRLRNLARPRVTAWVTTSSNTLRTSTLEHLARFDDAFVQLHPPISASDAAQFSKLPKAGVWVNASALRSVAGKLPGARRLAVTIDRGLDEVVAEQLSRARPTMVFWAPHEPVSVLQWSLFRQLPGRKFVIGTQDVLLPVTCTARDRSEPSVELHVANLLALSSDVYPCGSSTRVVVPANVDRWLVQSLIVRDPSVELVLEVGADDEVASKARVLLDLLKLGPPR